MSTHIDEWIEETPKDEYEAYAKWYLHHKRLPAYLVANFESIIDNFDLFCSYNRHTLKVTGASRMGDVWLAYDLSRKHGYDI